VKSLAQIQTNIKTGELTISGITNYYLNNIQKNQHLNAFIDTRTKKCVSMQKKFQQFNKFTSA